MKQKIFVPLFSTDDRYTFASNFYFTDKDKAVKYSEEFIKDSSIFTKYTIETISPAEKGIPGESIQGTYKAQKNKC